MKTNKQPPFLELTGTFSIRFPEEDPTRQELAAYVHEMYDQLPAFARLNISETLRPLIRAGLKLHKQGLLEDAIAGVKFEPSKHPAPTATED